MEQESQLARLGLFDARVPRYTSYPTAPHFSTTVGGPDMAEWLQAIAPDSRISLYVHVPFCRRLCWFCACRTQGTKSDDPVLSYADLLREEIGLIRRQVAPDVTLSRLHWGGGTPTLLPAPSIGMLAKTILDAFPMAKDAEFSVEIDPNEVDGPRLDALAAAGMNRASIGVQDFDPEIQRTIGRDQSYEVTRRAAEMLRARGIGSLNADILYGLPHQTEAKITASVQKLLSLNPDRVALYGYAHVPWMARRQQMIPSDALPTPEERLRLFETARRLFVADGYEEVGIDHFARPTDGLARAARAGRLRRNFQGYTDDLAPVLVGVGASAISRFPQGYAQNAPATSAHVKAVREGRLSVTRGHRFSEEDLVRARMIEALMCDFHIDAAEMRDRFGLGDAGLAEMFDKAARPFGDMVEVDREGFRIPDRARPLTRMIARAFDSYDLSHSGHSPAV
ncbi:MAG: oxygen-independent coproporphyrinogen III oxidase [Paracoccaceae bacterium]